MFKELKIRNMYQILSKIEFNTIGLDIDQVMKVEEAKHIITKEEAETLANYFNEPDPDQGYKVSDFEGKTCMEAAKTMDECLPEENLQHIIVTLFSTKYHPIY